MGKIEDLKLKLCLIENEVLEAVHLAKWDKTEDGPCLALSDKILPAWKRWREQFVQFCKEKNVVADANAISHAIERAELAAAFQIRPEGPLYSRWKIIFDYNDTFRDLHQRMNELDQKDESALAPSAEKQKPLVSRLPSEP